MRCNHMLFFILLEQTIGIYAVQQQNVYRNVEISFKNENMYHGWFLSTKGSQVTLLKNVDDQTFLKFYQIQPRLSYPGVDNP